MARVSAINYRICVSLEHPHDGHHPCSAIAARSISGQITQRRLFRFYDCRDGSIWNSYGRLFISAAERRSQNTSGQVFGVDHESLFSRRHETGRAGRAIIMVAALLTTGTLVNMDAVTALFHLAR